jgi:acyl-CoA reductase-like NAD-dependent aldehyde dehydrogenase
MAKNNSRNGKTNGAVKTTKPAPRVARLADDHGESRLPVLKTYKIYIGGKFPRTESGRYYALQNARGEAIANICDSSRKDFRDAVVAARSAQASWGSRSAYNRGQILYRIAEMLEGRTSQFVEELSQFGVQASACMNEVHKTIDRWLYYAGWCDKYQQVFSSVNPVSSSHFNFSLLEPTGVVSVIAPEQSALLGLTSVIAPVIAGGNTCVVLASYAQPQAAISFAEILATSDLPGGVVNILTGRRAELLEHFASHMDVNACVYCGDDLEEMKTVRTKSSLNVKRTVIYDRVDWSAEDAQSPYFILNTQEVKTTWHPIGT